MQPPGWGPQQPPQGYGPPGPYAYGPPPPPQRQGLSGAAVVLIVLVVLVALTGGSCMLCVCVGAASSRSSSKSSKSAPEPRSDLPDTGEVGYVYNQKGDHRIVYLFRSLELADRWSDAAGARDYGKMAALDPLAMKVPGGTRIKAIGGSFLYKEVRVEEGTHRGSSAWLAKDYVHRSRL